MKIKISKTKLYIFIGIVIILAIIGFWLAGFGKKEINVGEKKEENMPVGSLRGEACENAGMRPIAVMLASDPQARPLSGISQADIVVEIPVTPNGVTRLMAVFQCNTPEEIGSVRSARGDFLPLAASFEVIYAHWGGEKETLDKLNSGILDNLDALKNRHNEFFRKRGVKAPHNGFASFESLKKSAKEYSYSASDSFSGYPRQSGEKNKNLSQLISEVKVEYSPPFDVLWKYKPESNSYVRNRGGLPETDKASGEQVEVKNVVVINTASRHLRDQYIEVSVIGSGEARVYKNGIVKNITWEKKDFSGKLYFYDQNGEEIQFEPGPIWIHYVL